MTTQQIIFTAILFPLALLVSGCRPSSGTEKKPDEVRAPNAIELNAAQYSAAGIVFGTAERRRLNPVLKVSGTISTTPRNLASVSVPLGGFVKQTEIVQGTRVTKGEVIALIENFMFIELQQNYLETRAKFTYAEIEFKRHSELYKDNVYSEKNLQQTEVEYKTLKIQMMGLEQKLAGLGINPHQLNEDKITSVLPVVAPISGFVRKTNINIGKYMGPTDVICEIVNPEEVVLEMVVFEKDVRKVTQGQSVRFSTPDDPAKEYSAVISQAGHALNDDKTMMAYARISQPAPALMAGASVNASIETDSLMAYAVPEEAVVGFNEKFYLFVYKGGRTENGKIVHDFIATEVIKGITNQGFCEIRMNPGFDFQGSRLVVKGAYSLLAAWKNAGEMAC